MSAVTSTKRGELIDKFYQDRDTYLVEVGNLMCETGKLLAKLESFRIPDPSLLDRLTEETAFNVLRELRKDMYITYCDGLQAIGSNL